MPGSIFIRLQSYYNISFMKPFFIGNIEIKTPIIQGGMGVGISLSGLASAVANEGGIGVISCAGLGLLYPKGKGDYTEKCRTSARPPPIPDTGKQNEVGAHCIFFKSGQDYM